MRGGQPRPQTGPGTATVLPGGEVSVGGVEGLGVTCRRGEAVPRKLSRKAVSCCLGGGHCTTQQKKQCVFFLNWVAS